ncbi:MAG: NACHT domain-containing protein, partial [Acidobacteria bacterium]|nr:NACHT domain-containing protein [Acidobacteriota bacterium]
MAELASSILMGLAVRFAACIAKKTGEAFRDLFSEGEAKSILNQAFMEFKEKAILENKNAQDEKVLLEVFEQFFNDDRTIINFQTVFDGQSREVDFNLLDEIFTKICIDKNIEIPKFNFFLAMEQVIKEIERLAQKQKELQDIFQTNHLTNIYKCLQKRGTENNWTFAQFKYLDQLKRYHNKLMFTGIPDLKEKKDVELPAIFVMPRAGENVTTEDYRDMMREKQGEDEFTGEEIQLRRMMIAKKKEEKTPAKFAQVFAESTNRCFVVLGKPGSGKSTLLKYLVLEAACSHLESQRDSQGVLFPILVEIRKLENALIKTNQPDYNILDFLYHSVRTYYNLTLPDGFFEEYLGSGRALLLFDGLDEVAAEARRAQIQQMISTFAASYPMGNTVIVTSRIAGYNRAQFSTTDYRHFTLEDFNDEEINMFIDKWYRSRLVNEKEADDKATDLKNAFAKKPRIKELARNPLLLTIIGIIHRYEAQLPEDRLVLYDKATEALLYTWDNVKDIIDEKFKLSHRRRFLGQVAFHLQSLEKGDEAGTMIHRNDLYKILLADFCKVFNCDEWGAQALVNEFIENIRSRAGLLVELGPDRFGFAHKTFQEYFAARWLANETTLKFNLQIMIDYVDQFIDNAFWHETLILALQALPEEQALNVLKHILERDTQKIEPYFYHNHYFVMKFIAEKGEWLNDKEFVEKQIDDFFRFSWNRGKDRNLFSNYTWDRFTNWVSSVSDSLAGSILAKKLLLLAEDEKQDWYLRRDCAEAVGNLGFKDKAVMERLLHLAEDEKQHGYLRRSCAEAVGNLGFKDKALEILLHLAEDKKQDGYLRRSCASAVG